MNGTSLIQHILVEVSHGLVRLWRQNAGQAWAGKARKFTKLDHVKVYPGDVLIRNGHPVQLGEKGIADLVGYTMYVVQPEDVGNRVAVFTGVEAKGDDDSPTAEQKAWLDRVRAHGGRTGVAYSPADADAITKGELLPHTRTERRKRA